MLLLVSVALSAELVTFRLGGALVEGDAVRVSPVTTAAYSELTGVRVDTNLTDTLGVVSGSAIGAGDEPLVIAAAAGETLDLLDDAWLVTGSGGVGYLLALDGTATGGGIVKGSLAEGAERLGGGIAKGSLSEGSERVGGGVIKGTLNEGSERYGGGIIKGTLNEGAERVGGGIIKGTLSEGAERLCDASDLGCYAVTAYGHGDESGATCTDALGCLVVEDGVLWAEFGGATMCTVEVWSGDAAVARTTAACDALGVIASAPLPLDVAATLEVDATGAELPAITWSW